MSWKRKPDVKRISYQSIASEWYGAHVWAAKDCDREEQQLIIVGVKNLFSAEKNRGSAPGIHVTVNCGGRSDTMLRRERPI